MKKIILFLLCFYVINVFASKVPLKLIKKVAINAYYLNTGIETGVEDIIQLKPQYLISSNNQGNFENDTPRLFDCSLNPFNKETIIPYYLPESSYMGSIFIYDMRGKEILTLKLIEKGKSQIKINRKDLYKGMFIYTLVVDNKIFDTKKMIVN